MPCQADRGSPFKIRRFLTMLPLRLAQCGWFYRGPLSSVGYAMPRIKLERHATQGGLNVHVGYGTDDLERIET